MPLEQLPVIGLPLADTLDPTLQVLVEAGYNRAISPGQPTPWNLLYFPNPISFGEDLLVSIPTGLDNGIQDLFGVRRFGTQRPGPYGVGGPPVTYLTPPGRDDNAAGAAELARGRDRVDQSDHSAGGPRTIQPANERFGWRHTARIAAGHGRRTARGDPYSRADAIGLHDDRRHQVRSTRGVDGPGRDHRVAAGIPSLGDGPVSKVLGGLRGGRRHPPRGTRTRRRRRAKRASRSAGRGEHRPVRDDRQA